MVNKHIIRAAAIVLFLVAMPAVFSCDTSKGMDPYILIHVDLGANPIDDAHKLTIVFYVDETWTTFYMSASYASGLIYVPPFHTGDYPLYFEIIWDANGNQIVGDFDGVNGDWYYGWHGKTDRDTMTLDPLVRPDMEFMYVSINMDDNHGEIVP